MNQTASPSPSSDSADAGKGVAGSLAGQNILIVDDDPIVAAMLEMVFSACGGKVVLHAGDGAKARAFLAGGTDRVDIVTLDLRMPNEDGVSALRRLADLGYKGRLVLLSGEQPEVIRGAERLAGMFGLNCVAAFRKPVNPMAVVEALRAVEPKRKRAVQDAVRQGIVLSDVHYQPRVSTRTGHVTGFEALSRFVDGQGEAVPPDLAIEAAEFDGSIDALTWAIFDKAMAGFAPVAALGHKRLSLSVNVSARTISQTGFVDELRSVIARHRLQTGDIIVELTETRLADDLMAALENLTRLRIYEIGVALDDFGTGHSNLEQLGNYPFTELKIDKGFVMRAETDRFAASSVETAVQLARRNGLLCVAEGVETRWAFDMVRNLGVDEVQGYLFSKAVPADAIAALARTVF